MDGKTWFSAGYNCDHTFYVVCDQIRVYLLYPVCKQKYHNLLCPRIRKKKKVEDFSNTEE